MRNFKKSGFMFMVCIVLVLSVALSACTKGSTTEAENTNSGEPQKQLKMAGILMQSDIEWFKYVQLGMKDAAKQLNVDLTIGNANMDVNQEANLVDTYASQGMDAIMLSALDSKASGTALKRAQDKGVTIVNYNTTVASDIMKYFVGIDNFQLGAQMGKNVADYVQKNLNGKAKVALVTISMFEVGKQREEGFLSEIKKVPGIEVVAKQDGADPEKGANVTETILQGNPDVDIIWAAAEGGAMGAIVGVKTKGLAKKVKVFGTDMSLQGARELLDGNSPLSAVSTQQPYEIGFKSVEQAVKAVRKETVEASLTVPLDLYSKDDKDKINKYLEKYKGL